jgi:hypothetical protein
MIKILMASIVAAFVFTGCGGGSANVDLCRCLTEPGNSAYMRDNDDACRDAISKELGVDNWEKVNMSNNPSVSAKFDALVNRCQ